MLHALGLDGLVHVEGTNPVFRVPGGNCATENLYPDFLTDARFLPRNAFCLFSRLVNPEAPPLGLSVQPGEGFAEGESGFVALRPSETGGLPGSPARTSRPPMTPRANGV